jgi:hypothetical protein
MLTIGGEVTWQRDGETGEWKIRPTEENDHARPNIVGRLDQSPMGFYVVPILNLQAEGVTFPAQECNL